MPTRHSHARDPLGCAWRYFLSRSRNPWAPALAAALLIPAAGPIDARADEADSAPNAEEIIVTATRNQRPLSQVPMSVSVLGRDEILETPAQAVDDLLRTVPGVNLPAGSSLVTHPTSQAASIRGLGRNRALVLLDGVPLNDGFGGWVNWTKIPYRNIERIEVVRGGNSSLYGTYAMGGVINVLTRPAAGRQIELEGSYGTQETGQAHAYASETLGDTAFSISYDYYDSDGYEVIAEDERGPIDTNAYSKHSNLQFEINHGFASGSSAWLRTNLFRDQRNVGTPLSKDSREAWDLAMGAKASAGDWGDLKFSFFTSLQDFDNANVAVAPDRASETLALTQDIPAFDIGASAQWSRAFSWLDSSASAGMDFRHTEGENRETIDLPILGLDSSTTKGRQNALGVYAEMSFYPLPRLEALASIRLDYWENYAASRQVAGQPTTGFADRSEVEVSPRLSLGYAMDGPWSLRGGVYRAFRAPTLNELYRGFYAEGMRFLPNAALEPELLRIGGEIGVDFEADRMRASLTGFWNELDDTVAFVFHFVPSPGASFLQRENLVATRSRGFEYEMQFDLPGGWALSPSYVFTDSTITKFPDRPERVGNWLQDIPRHEVSVILTYKNPELLNFMARGRYLGKRYANDANTQELESFGVLDLSASRELGENYEVFLMVENVLDEEYEASQTGNIARIGAPRQVWAGLRASY
ncbi:MAG: TonB-dependent receptor [Myxococcota bacterium]|nr:TonB-dependent receptor [Myxococcota bacterium]